MTDKIRWGILGTGNIAAKFAQGLAVLPQAELAAVGSRTQESANTFGDKYNIPRRHASYEALANDAEVDVIYISTPHTFHKENSLLCLQAGKAVLCEKPFTINAAEAKAVIDFAREKQLFLMEAMWTRYLPLVVKIRQMLADDVIGHVEMFTADLGFRWEFDPQHRLYNPHLGGGALLDVGIYPVSMAWMVFGQAPTTITGAAHLGKTGVDENASIIFGYEQGQIATLYASVRTFTPSEAIIMGTKGRLKIHAFMFRPTKLTLTLNEQEDKVVEIPFEGNGYNYQAAEVMRCLQAGKLESDSMPLDESLSIMHAMDKIRAQWNLKYPTE